MPPLRLGVLGLGRAGLRHAKAATESQHWQLTALADPLTSAREKAGVFNVPVFESTDAVWESALDAVVVAVPHGLLLEESMRGLERNIPLLVEKPMAENLTSARTLAARAAETQTPVMVNYNHRYRPEFQQAKRWLDEDRIGTPTQYLTRMIARPSAVPDWVWESASPGGGMLIYNGAHPLDHLLWFEDSPVRDLDCMTSNLHYANEQNDTSVSLIRFRSGATASLMVLKPATPTFQQWETIIFGTRGSIRIVGDDAATLVSDGKTESSKIQETDRFVAALDAFATALHRGEAPSPDTNEALRSFECLAALHRAHRTNQRVSL